MAIKKQTKTKKIRQTKINKRLRNFILISLSLHIGLFVLFLFVGRSLNIFGRAKKLDLPAPPQAVRVNMTALPDMYPSTSEENTEQSAKKPVKKKAKEKPKKKSKEKIKKKAKKKIKKKKTPPSPPSKKQEKKQTETQEEKTSPTDSSTSTSNISSLNESESKAQRGEELSQEETALLNAYLTDLEERVYAGWNLPRRLAGRGFSADVEIRIGKEGRITYKALVSSSGNEQFDRYALKALEGSSPSPPPKAITHFLQEGIVFTLSGED